MAKNFIGALCATPIGVGIIICAVTGGIKALLFVLRAIGFN